MRSIAAIFYPARLFCLGLVLELSFFGSLALGQTPSRSGTFVRKQEVFDSPNSGATVIKEASAGQRAQFLRASASKRWVQIRWAQTTGWVPADSFRLGTSAAAPSIQGIQANPGAATLDQSVTDNLTAPGNLTGPGEFDGIGDDVLPTGQAVGDRVAMPSDHRLAKFDRKFDQYLTTRKGRLFDKPSRFAVQSGTIEPGDEVDVLRLSPNGKWARIKLMLTAEEGWYPAEWIVLKQKPRLDRWGRFGLDGSLGWGTKGTKLQTGGAISFNLLPLGFEKSPRDRLELMVSVDAFRGETLSDEVLNVSAKYLVAAAALRYVGSTDDGFMALSGELGPLLKQTRVTRNDGVDDSLLASGIPVDGNSIGLMLGVVGFVAFHRNIMWHLGFRTYLASDTHAAGFTGISLRF